MPRYFIEVSYMGTNYAGFQVQQNANTIQAEVEKALHIYFRKEISLTGSSRTDAGVHAKQNYFHFDSDFITGADIIVRSVYHLNAILPDDIVIQSISQVNEEDHCRFKALSRSYEYTIYQSKDPFLLDRAYFYPYTLDLIKLQQAADLLFKYTDFQSFAKKHNQSHTNQCTIIESKWKQNENCIIYNITANRFLRGMVRGLVGTMLKVGRGINSVDNFKTIIESKNPSSADFSVPPQGLTLLSVNYL